jgi:4-hydroxy-3-methylbut-2-en-1-yl diphosphate reductase
MVERRKGDQMRVVLAQPRGFCAGVERAIEIVERALKLYGPPVYVRHEIVHNKHVVEDLKAKGAIFVEEVTEVPEGAITVFSAHGVSEAVEDESGARSLSVIDATCPLVAKVHNQGKRYARKDYEVILIGHEGHPEVEGTMGRIRGTVHLVSSAKDALALEVNDPNMLAYVTQTTLSVDDTREVIEALKSRFPKIVGPDVKDICYATQNRQAAVRELAKSVDVLLVVGAQNSSNSNRLREIGEEMGVPSYLIDDVHGLNRKWLDGRKAVGVTAGASAPEELVQELIEGLREIADIQLETLDGIEENVYFNLPHPLREMTA